MTDDIEPIEVLGRNPEIDEPVTFSWNPETGDLTMTGWHLSRNGSQREILLAFAAWFTRIANVN